MNKKTLLIVASAICVVLIGVLLYMNARMQTKQEENEQMIEVLKMDKAEMENEYQQFAFAIILANSRGDLGHGGCSFIPRFLSIGMFTSRQ